MRRIAVFLFSILVYSANADVTLPKIFGDNMVLQRDRAIIVWGWAAPKEKISIQLGCPIAFTLFQYDRGPSAWKIWLELADAACSRGANLHPLVSGRPFGMLVGLQLANPFSRYPTMLELNQLPFQERYKLLQNESRTWDKTDYRLRNLCSSRFKTR